MTIKTKPSPISNFNSIFEKDYEDLNTKNMYKYKKQIINIYKNFGSNLNPGIRYAFQKISKKTEFLILGINPSNSYQRFKNVLKNSIHKGRLEKVIYDQKSYDNFLSNEDNEDDITLLKKLAHKHHPHFNKHTDFAHLLDIYNFEFFDLFPIWMIDQDKLLYELENNLKLKNKIMTAFDELIYRLPNLKGLLFFNAKAGDYYFKHKQIQPKIISVKLDTQQNNSNLKKAEISLENRVIKILCFGIGGQTFGKKQREELALKSKRLI